MTLTCMQLSSIQMGVTDKDNPVLTIPRTQLGHGDGAVALALTNLSLLLSKLTNLLTIRLLQAINWKIVYD